MTSLEWAVSQSDTREAILRHASRLFAQRGYRGTSTRDIAAAVGIKQPSVYSHFTSKQEIAEELLRRDLTAGIAALQRVNSEGRSHAEALYRYLVWEFTHVRSTSYDLRSLYLGGGSAIPDFAEGQSLSTTYGELIAELVRGGIEEGSFDVPDPAFAVRAIDAVILEVIRGTGEGIEPGPDEPHVAADFVMRALLREPAALRQIREAAAS